MTDEMLDVARSNAPIVAERIGYSNVEFRKGRIQDLALDLEKLDAELKARPITDAASFLRADELAQELRVKHPLVATDSVDVVVSNCVLNLVEPKAKRQLFDEIFRVLRKGGRAVISDIVSDEEVPEHLQNDPELWSGCISGALTEEGFLQAFSEAGFYGMQILKRDEQPWQTVEGIEFRSVTIEAFKGKQGPCFERNQAVIYRGPFQKCSMTTITGWNAASATRFATRPTISIARRPIAISSSSSSRWLTFRWAKRNRSIVRTPPAGIRRKPRARITMSRPKRAVAATAGAVVERGFAAMSETIRATRPEPPPNVSADVEVANTPVPKWAIGEFFGTFLLVFFGCGSVCAAVATGAQVGVFQVAIVWGIGIATAIYLTGSLSSAHLNPAVTIASAVWSRFPVRLVVPYIGVQMLGAFAAAALLYSIFSGASPATKQSTASSAARQAAKPPRWFLASTFPTQAARR